MFFAHFKGLGCGTSEKKKVIPKGGEHELVESLKCMAKCGGGRSTKEEVKDTIRDYEDEHKIKAPFTNNRPTEDWFQNFRKRHKVSLKKPEALQQCRREVTNDSFIIYNFL